MAVKTKKRNTKSYELNRISFSNIYKVLTVIWAMFILLLLFVTKGSWDFLKVLAITILTLIMCMCFVAAVMYSLWHIKLQGDLIEYRSMLGRIFRYECQNIKMVKQDRSDAIIIELDDKKKIKIQDSKEKNVMERFLIENQIEILPNCTKEVFVIGYPQLGKGSCIVCILFGVICIAFGSLVDYVPIAIMGIIIEIFSVFTIITGLFDCWEINNGEICHRRFYRKEERIAFSEIAYYTTGKTRLGDACITLHSFDGKKMTILTALENVDLLKQVIEEEGWPLKQQIE